jgi:hypothetical protein
MIGIETVIGRASLWSSLFGRVFAVVPQQEVIQALFSSGSGHLGIYRQALPSG